MAKKKSFAGGKSCAISAQDMKEAENVVVKEIQKSIDHDFEKKNGRYHTLRPVLDADGLCVVGRRLQNNVMSAAFNPPEAVTYLPSWNASTHGLCTP